MIIPGASHTDLYDNLSVIPFDKIEDFFRTSFNHPVALSANGTCKGSDANKGICTKEPMAADGIVRLSKIEVYPQYLDEYMKYASEVGEISLRTEPGVLTMYAVGEQENPCNITILETYSSKAAY